MKKKQAKAARKAAPAAKPARKAKTTRPQGSRPKGAKAEAAETEAAGPRESQAKRPKAKAPERAARDGAKPGRSPARSRKSAAGKDPAEAPSPARSDLGSGPHGREAAGPGPLRARPIPREPDNDAGAGSEAEAHEDRASLDKVMASLTRIFGGRDVMSDAELDALLDDKMASGEIPPSAALDPLDEAQSLIYEAWNTEGPRKAVLARRALELSEDCADAYLILAQEEAKTRDAALDLYRRAYEAGRRALDPSLFAKEAGNFWAIMETRPYMRARLGLAECLWDLGRKDEALGHLRELMRLNPSDNQGVRYILLQCLLESGADEELGELLDRYGRDPSPAIAYTRALWQFRREGRGKISEAALAEALRANPHVPAYLLKRKALPARVPAEAAIGSPEEAEAYAAGALEVWHQTLGAVEWLASRA
jgi:tetratricopeptide (TPR) repeat protein